MSMRKEEEEEEEEEEEKSITGQVGSHRSPAVHPTSLRHLPVGVWDRATGSRDEYHSFLYLLLPFQLNAYYITSEPSSHHPRVTTALRIHPLVLYLLQ